MTDLNSELVAATAEMVARVGVDTATPAAGPDTALWTALTEAGFTGIGISEESDGSGGTLADALAVVSAAVGGGAVTMLIEHTVLARWLTARCGITLATRTATIALAGPECTVAESDAGPVLDGTITGVVHGSAAEVLVILLDSARPGQREPSIALVSPTAPGVTVTPGTDLVGAALDDFVFESAPVEAYAECPVGAAEVEQRGALAYSVALAAAAGAVRDATVRYATERSQFGRPLTKFQAVQQRLAGLAASTALMETAAESAVAEDAAGGSPARIRCAVAAAKVVTAVSAREVAAAGHQIHGAIGFTSEHHLGRATTALWAWRGRYGSENPWTGVLAEEILDHGTDVWDIVIGRAPAVPNRPAEGNH
ncbi:acyl-CoA dehydrogenase family protein [Nocardia rhamnosiphila]|uniref:acyl-CoA dehydrogenase family protein n=1 Tax=Nocardia rhamnosiphila TaxID=426716 RepID=UPI0033DF1943